MTDQLSGGLILGVAGAAVGAFFGFPGLGFAVGSALGGALFPPENRLPDVEGPRLNDLRVQASTYGLPIPEIWGSYRMAGNIIWARPIAERKVTTEVESGGKGGGPSATQQQTTYTYDVSFAVGLCAGPCDGIGRIWADGKLIWDFRSQGTDPDNLLNELNAITNASGLVNEIVFYPGDETQQPDPHIQTFQGFGDVPAYRGLCYVVFETLQLAKFGNRIPNLEFEVIRSGTIDSGMRCAQLPTIFDTTIDSGFRTWWSAQARPNGRYPDQTTSLTTGARVDFPVDTVGSQGWLRRIYDDEQNVVGHEFAEWIHAINGNLISEDRWSMTTAELPNFFRWVCPVWGLHGERAFIYDSGGGGSISTHYLVIKSGPSTYSVQAIPVISNAFIRVDGAYYDETVGKLFITMHGFGGGLGSRIYLLRYNWAPFSDPGGSLVGEEQTGSITSLENMFQGMAPKPHHKTGTIVVGQNDTGTNGRLYIYNKLDFTDDRGQFIVASPNGHLEFDILDDDMWLNSGTPSKAEVGFQPSPCNPATDDLLQFVYHYVWSDGNNRWEAPDGTDLGTGAGDSVSQCVAPPLLDSRDCPEGGIYGLVIAKQDPVVLVGLKHSTNYAVSDSPGTQNFFQNPGNGGQTYRRAFFFTSGITAGTFQLSEIVEDLCESVGLDALDIDVSELTDTVYGFARTKPSAARNVIGALQSAYFFDGLESDYTLKFPKRGRSVTATVIAEQLAGHESGQEVPDDVEPRITQELELAREITVKHIDQNKAYQQGFQYARRLITQSNIVDNVDLPIVLTPTEARQSAEILLYNSWQQRTLFTLRVPRDFVAVDPTDVIDVTDGLGNTYRFRVLTVDYSLPLLITMECAPEQSGIYTSIIPGGEAPEDDQTQFIPLDTQFLCLDVPLLLDANNSPGFYMGVYPAGVGTWGGAAVYRSFDLGVSYSWAETGTNSARFGYAEDTLPAPPLTTVWDETSVLTVTWDKGDPPVSATRDQVLNGANVAALGAEVGVWEIVQFSTVTDLGDDRYEISDFLRGRRGTEWTVNTHGPGQIFVLLSTATILNIGNTAAQIGVDQLIKGVTTGQNIAQASARVCTPQSVRLIPFSPVHIEADRDLGTSDITIDWVRRDRLSGDWLNSGGTPMSEDTLEFEIDIIDPAGPTVVRTVTGITAETYVYTLADQTTDFGGAATDFDVEIFQISATVGRGYPGAENIQV